MLTWVIKEYCFFFFFKQKTAYEIGQWLEFRRVLFRSDELEPGEILDLTLRRTDLQVTSFTGDLSFISNDPDTPNFVIPLTGTITFEAQEPLEINFTDRKSVV